MQGLPLLFSSFARVIVSKNLHQFDDGTIPFRRKIRRVMISFCAGHDFPCVRANRDSVTRDPNFLKI